MTRPSLTIAYADATSPQANVFIELFRGHGHEVSFQDDRNGFLSLNDADVYVVGRALSDGTSGLDLLEALRLSGRKAPVVMVDERPSFQELSRAIELGATDFVLRPMESDELCGAVERAAARATKRPRIDAEPRPHSCERSYTIDDSTVGRAAREISAFLVNEGVASAHRVRIASALAEVVDNTCRHAYPDSGGRIQVQVQLQGARVQLAVEDFGAGFDAALARLERVPAALPGQRRSTPVSGSSTTGLGRVERLCESHAISSGPEGTRVEMTFELTPVRFEEEPEHLAETDFLDPSRAKSLIASLRRGRTDLSGVAPAMALTIGRILGGLDAEVRSARRQ